jgi:butyrate kinase
MFDIEACLRQQLRESMTTKQTLVFPEADEPRVISACSRLVKFANIVLLGRKEDVAALVDSGAAPLECSRKRFFTVVRFVDVSSDPLAGHLAERLAALSQGKKWELTLEAAQALLRDPVYYGIMSVREGYADAILGGVTHASRDFFLPCLRILDKQPTVYEMALFALPDDHPDGIYRHNLVMFADVALNPVPTPEALAEIAVGACRTMRDLIPVEDLPEVNGAILSYSTRGSGQGPSVERVRAAEPLIRAKLEALRAERPLYGTINIVTEMQISVALSEKAARTKLGEEYEQLPGAGRANVLIAPNLDTGNLLYHIYSTRYRDAKTVLVIGGLSNQALDFSRSSSAEEVSRGGKALILRRHKSGARSRVVNDHFFPRHRILTVEPLTASTKVALFAGEDLLAQQEYAHDPAVCDACADLVGQVPFRLEALRRFLAEQSVTVAELRAVVARGGLLRPIESGTYEICDRMLEDLRHPAAYEHVSNLGGILARGLVEGTAVPAYTVDPPVVDELDETSRVTGYPESDQEAAWHALSQKAVAKRFGEQHNREYEDLSLIVAHLGAGISVGSHLGGRCVKVRNALFDGPLGPNRAGSLPGYDLVNLCYSGIPKQELIRRLVKASGLKAYLGTDRLDEIAARIQAGDRQADVVLEAMVEQIASEIASHVPKFKGTPVDQIILTGQLCHSALLCERLRRDLRSLGIRITIYPGDRDLEAMRDGALRVLRGVEEARLYLPLRDTL